MKKFIILSCTIILLILSAGAFLFAQHYHTYNSGSRTDSGGDDFSYSQAPAKYTPAKVVSPQGKQASRTYRIPECREVEYGMTFNVRIKTGSKSRVTVSSPENILDYIKVKAENGVLRIETDPGISIMQEGNNTMSLEIEIPSLSRLAIAGSTRTQIHGGVDKSSFTLHTAGMSVLEFDSPILSRDVEIAMTGMSSMDVPKIRATALELSLTGVSRVKTTLIDADRLRMQLAGQSSVTASDKISCDRVDCSVTGVSEVSTQTFMASKGKLSVTGMSRFKAEESNASGVSIYSENSSIMLGDLQMNPDKYYYY